MKKRTECWEIMVTPNLHHLRIVRESPDLKYLYTKASLSLPDGWPVAWLASRLSAMRVERISGSDVFESILDLPAPEVPLLLIGGTPGHKFQAFLERCVSCGWQVIHEPAPEIELANPEMREDLIRRVANKSNGAIVVLGVGAPKQEQLAVDIARMPGSGTLLCLGMSLGFSSGMVRRAPQFIRSTRLEWAFRALQEPRRLLPRYLMDAKCFCALMNENQPASH